MLFEMSNRIKQFLKKNNPISLNYFEILEKIRIKYIRLHFF
jgi:hypothetical protein